MSKSRIVARCAAAVLLAVAGSGWAGPLAPSSVAGSVFFNHVPPLPVQVDGFGSFSLFGSSGQVKVDAAATPSPWLLSEVLVEPGVTGRASAQLKFQMQVVDSTSIQPSDVQVHVDVAGRASGSSNTVDLFAGFAVKALWALEDLSLGQVPVFSEGIDSGALQGSFVESFGHRVDLTLKANHIYLVTLTADAFAAAVSGPTATASAYIDPVFSFGAGTGDQYAFLFSDGIGNAPVPEPSALALLGTGLAAMWLKRRRNFGEPTPSR